MRAAARVGGLVALCALLGCSTRYVAVEQTPGADLRVFASFIGGRAPHASVVALPSSEAFTLPLTDVFAEGGSAEIWVFSYALATIEGELPALEGLDVRAAVAALNPVLDPAMGVAPPEPLSVLMTTLKSGGSADVVYTPQDWTTWLRVSTSGGREPFRFRLPAGDGGAELGDGGPGDAVSGPPEAGADATANPDAAARADAHADADADAGPGDALSGLPDGASADAGGDAGCTPAGLACPQTNGLLAYFPMDGDGTDALGAHSGVISGLSTTDGRIGRALRFSSLANSTFRLSGPLALTGSRSFCLWVRPAARANLAHPLVVTGVAGSGDLFSLSSWMPNGGTCPHVTAGAPVFDNWGSPCLVAGADAPVGSWSFLCATYDGSLVTLFLNGTSIASQMLGLYNADLGSTWLGSNPLGGTTTTPTLDGDLDEVSVWSRALEASEVGGLYQGGTGCTLGCGQ
jgi:hypothetical protein